MKAALFIKVILIIFAISFLAGCENYDDEPEIEVSLHSDRVTIQALRDGIKVKDVRLNRGNCKLIDNFSGFNLSPHKWGELKYGDIKSVYGICDHRTIREIEVTTLNHTYTFSFHN